MVAMVEAVVVEAMEAMVEAMVVEAAVVMRMKLLLACMSFIDLNIVPDIVSASILTWHCKTSLVLLGDGEGCDGGGDRVDGGAFGSGIEQYECAQSCRHNLKVVVLIPQLTSTSITSLQVFAHVPCSQCGRRHWGRRLD
jgi:hypothetical protein